MTVQEAVRHRLMRHLRPGAIVVSAHPLFSQREKQYRDVVVDSPAKSELLHDCNLYFWVNKRKSDPYAQSVYQEVHKSVMDTPPRGTSLRRLPYL